MLISLYLFFHLMTTPIDINLNTYGFLDNNNVLVQNSLGGPVDYWDQQLTFLKGMNKERIIVDGYCASACTMILFKKYDFNVCATPTAYFGFHKPYVVEDGEILIGRDWIEASNDTWNEWLKAYKPIVMKALKGKNIPNPSVSGDTKAVWIKASWLIPECDIKLLQALP